MRGDERTGLIVAVTVHLLLVVALVIQVYLPRPAIAPPERMTVNLASDVSLEDTAPDPVEESRMATAPELDMSPAPAPERADPEPVVRPEPQRDRPREAAPERERSRPDRQRDTSSRQASSSQSRGGSRISDNFLDGAGASTTTEETRTPASQIGASAKASLFQAVGRQLRPHWRPVDGADREKLVSKVRFRLNPDGSLAGRPTLVGQRGITDANRPQASRHAENAIRAVQLAAPFDLPEEYYEAWKLVTVDFDWSLTR